MGGVGGSETGAGLAVPGEDPEPGAGELEGVGLVVGAALDAGVGAGEPVTDPAGAGGP